MKTHHLLLAEDNAMNRKLIQAQLLSLGFTVQIVTDGKAAVEAFRNSRFALILMDCEMPEMDGFEATLAIRKLEKESGAAAVPILAMTGHTDDDIRFFAKRAGMNEFIVKPVETEELAKALAAFLPG